MHYVSNAVVVDHALHTLIPRMLMTHSVHGLRLMLLQHSGDALRRLAYVCSGLLERGRG